MERQRPGWNKQTHKSIFRNVNQLILNTINMWNLYNAGMRQKVTKFCPLN